MTTLKSLRKKALAATPGPWHFDCGNGEVESRNKKHHRIAVAHRDGLVERMRHCEHFDLGYNPPDFPMHPDDDMDFIAAANPQTIITLLDEIEQARETLETIYAIEETKKDDPAHVSIFSIAEQALKRMKIPKE